MVIHGFRRKLAESKAAQRDIDINIIKASIAGCAKVEKTDEDTDRTGVDYIATLRRGGEILIDAKNRERGASRYWHDGKPELALEIWSVMPEADRQGVVGWTLNESTAVDYILYTFDASDTDECYLIPYQLLRMALIRQYKLWVETYGIRIQHSPRWRSMAIFVPARIVLEAVSNEMTKGA